MSGLFSSIICFFLNWYDFGLRMAISEFKHEARWHWIPRSSRKSATHRARGCGILALVLLCVLCGSIFAQTAARYAITGSGAPAGTCVISGSGYGQIYINRSNGDWYTCSGTIGTTTGTWVLSGNHSSGTGTVTSVSVVTANGFSGSVATATTTPAITINNPTALIATTSIQSPFYKSAAADTADAGVIRLGNAELIEWEATPTGTDLTLGIDANNVLSSSVPINATTGFRIGNTAASGNYLRGNGTNFISATIAAGDLPSGIDTTKIGNGDVTNTIFSFLNTVSSNVQTQLNAKQATGNYITALTGDATASGPGSAALTLATVIVAGGPTGSATVAPIITYDVKGRLITVSSATITPAVGSITGLGTGIGAALAINAGSAGAPVLFNGAGGTPSSLVGTNISGTAANLTAGSVTGLTIASGKSLTVSNILTLAGTDSTVMTFPTTSATIARTDAANTFTGNQGFGIAASTPIHVKAPATGASDTLTLQTAADSSDSALVYWRNNSGAALMRMGSIGGDGTSTLNTLGYFRIGTGTATFGSNERMRVHASGGVSIGNTTDPGAANLSINGTISFAVAGNGISLKSGTNTRAGNAALVGGTVTVSNTTVTANTVVLLTRKTSGGTIGTAITYSLNAGTSFTITSDNILDTSTFSYLLVENP